MVISSHNSVSIQHLSTSVWKASAEHITPNSTINVYVDYQKGDELYAKLTYQVYEKSVDRIGSISEKDSDNYIIEKVDLLKDTSNPVIPVTIPEGSDKFYVRIEFVGVISNEGTIDIDIRPEGEEF